MNINTLFKNLPRDIQLRIIQKNLPKVHRIPNNLKNKITLYKDPKYQVYKNLYRQSVKSVRNLVHTKNPQNAAFLAYVYRRSGFGIPKNIRKIKHTQKYITKVANAKMSRFLHNMARRPYNKRISANNAFKKYRNTIGNLTQRNYNRTFFH